MTHYLIDFKNDATDSQIAEYLQQNQCTVLKEFDKLNKVYHVESNILPVTTSIVELVQNDEESIIKLLEVVPLYTYPEADETITVTHADENNWWKLYSYNQIDLATDNTPVPIFGTGTNIYLVDSGIDISHPEFAGKDVTLLHTMVPNDFDDYTGHGTALASTMVGNTCGISDASLKVVKIFSNDPKTNPTKQSDLLYAFDAILNDAIFSPNLFSVVNLSWAIPKNEYVENKIRHLIDAGITVVVAAGNSGHPIEEVTPASMPEVITVGAYQEDFIPCDFSDYTDPTITSLTQNIVNTGALDVWAPGNKIYAAKSSKLGGGYGVSGGTSLAAAIQSASIAFNMSQNIYGQQTSSVHLDTQGQSKTNFILINARQGLLDLSDPKYINSTNKICTFENRETFEKSKPKYANKMYDLLSATQKIVIRVNNKEILQLGSPLISKYELKSTLPAGVAIEGKWLIATPTNEPTAGPTGVESFELQFTYYPEDTSIDPIDGKVLIVILGSAFDETTLPADDPTLDLVALINCRSALIGNCFQQFCISGQTCISTGKICTCL